MTEEMFAIGSPRWPGISKLNVEAGEVVQVIGKLMGTGGDFYHWDGSNLSERLIEELGDLLAACDFVIEMNLPRETIESRRAAKLELFRRWHAEATTPLSTDPELDLARAIEEQREREIAELGRVRALRARLIEAGCSHPADHVKPHRWEHDNGYGSQHMVEGERCALCQSIRYWKGSGSWVTRAQQDEYHASQP